MMGGRSVGVSDLGFLPRGRVHTGRSCLPYEVRYFQSRPIICHMPSSLTETRMCSQSRNLVHPLHTSGPFRSIIYPDAGRIATSFHVSASRPRLGTWTVWASRRP